MLRCKNLESALDVRPSFRVLIVAALLAVLPGCRRAPRPNVVVITIDTLRADHVGCYGYPRASTPAIDRLAREGVLCRDATAAAPVTLPSHSTIFTGLYPPAHGVRDNGSYSLGPRATTLASRLKKAGYVTQAFVSALVLNRRYGLDQGFDGYDDDLWSEDQPPLFMIRERPGARTAKLAARWIAQAGRSRKPFFLWVHFFDPHQPYTPPRDVPAPTPYDGEIAAADRAVGRVVGALRSAGLLDDTLLVLTADHGESLGEHGEKTHAIFVYDATVHVPLLFRSPRLFPVPREYAGPVRSVDIVPTVLGALGLPGKEETQGFDLGPALRGEAAGPELAQYSESLVSEAGFGMAPLQALRKGGFKYVRAPRPELYDLRRDPHELVNRFGEDRPRAAALERELTALLAESERRSVDPRSSPMSRETMETLMSLGYLAPATERAGMARRDPKDGIAILQKLEDARHCGQRKDWAGAERLLREILAEIPGHVSAWNVLGLALVRQGRLDEAREAYLASLRLEPRQDRVLTLLGTLALVKGDRAEARRLYRSALEVNPAFVEAMCNLGLLDEIEERWDEARVWLAKAEAADPGFPHGNRISADLWYERGDYRKALAGYERVLAVVPKDFECLVQAGNCARRLGDPSGAERRFREATRLRPDSWVPEYNLACLRASEGRAPDALRILEGLSKRDALPSADVLEKDPDLATVRSLPGFRRLRARPPENER